MHLSSCIIQAPSGCQCTTPSFPCSPCGIPKKNLTVTWIVGVHTYTFTLTYSAGPPPTWVGIDPLFNLTWTLDCTGGNITLSLIDSFGAGYAVSAILGYTCPPFHLYYKTLTFYTTYIDE